MPRRPAQLMLAASLSIALLACGKKGPPLPPLEGSIPRVGDLVVEQVGEEVRASFTLPLRPEAEGVDYVTTGLELWRRPAEAGASSGAELDEGGVTDFTKRAELVQEAKGEGLFDILARPSVYLSDPGAGLSGAPVHEYAVVLRTNLRKRGTLSNVVELEVLPVPDPPTGLELEAQEGGILVKWTAPELTQLASAEPAEPTDAADPEAEPTETTEGAEDGAEEQEPAAAASAPAPSFHVYRALGDRPFGQDPLTEQPTQQPQWADTDVVEGGEYRYRVRTVLAEGDRQVLSAPSEVLSIGYSDIFAPAAPAALRVIPDSGRTVNVLWNPNGERDLAGYGVYRREVGGEWKRLDPGNVRSASFVDRTATPGRTYEYAVTAYDGAEPPNESEQSVSSPLTIPAVGP